MYVQKTYIFLLSHIDIKIQPVNLNNGDDNKPCCSEFWVPPIKTH